MNDYAGGDGVGWNAVDQVTCMQTDIELNRTTSGHLILFPPSVLAQRRVSVACSIEMGGEGIECCTAAVCSAIHFRWSPTVVWWP